MPVGRIENNSTAPAQFENFGDGAYVFTGTFQSGRKLQDSTGYVTNGMNFEDTFILIKIIDSLGLDLKSNLPKAYSNPSNKYDNNHR